MVGVSDRRRLCQPGKVILVKKLYMSRHFAGSGLEIEIYRFDVRKYRVGKILILCAFLMYFVV